MIDTSKIIAAACQQTKTDRMARVGEERRAYQCYTRAQTSAIRATAKARRLLHAWQALDTQLSQRP